MKILVTTTNLDKFKIVKKLFQSSGFNNQIFCSLNDFDGCIKNDIQEIGTIENRAKNKAEQYKFILENPGYLAVIGVDDGIKLSESSKSNPDVKKIIPNIIRGNLLNNNDIVFIQRAFYILTKNNKSKSFITNIPFKYKHSNISEDFLKKKDYPLSYFLCEIDKTIPVSEYTQEQNNKYYLKYSKSSIQKCAISLKLIK